MAEPILGQFYDSLYSFLFINFILSADNKSAVERGERRLPVVRGVCFDGTSECLQTLQTSQI